MDGRGDHITADLGNPGDTELRVTVRLGWTDDEDLSAEALLPRLRDLERDDIRLDFDGTFTRITNTRLLPFRLRPRASVRLLAFPEATFPASITERATWLGVAVDVRLSTGPQQPIARSFFARSVEAHDPTQPITPTNTPEVPPTAPPSPTTRPSPTAPPSPPPRRRTRPHPRRRARLGRQGPLPFPAPTSSPGFPQPSWRARLPTRTPSTATDSAASRHSRQVPSIPCDGRSICRTRTGPTIHSSTR